MKDINSKTKLRENDILLCIKDVHLGGAIQSGQFLKVTAVYFDPSTVTFERKQTIKVNNSKYRWSIENFIGNFKLLIDREKELYSLLYE